MKICVVGAGAIGGLLAAKLQHAGEDVSVIARGPHLAAIKANGLKLIEENGNEIVARVKATDRIAEAGQQDLVILGMKAHQVEAVVVDLKQLYGPETMVLTAQNGIPWWYFFKVAARTRGASCKSVDPDGAIAANLPDRARDRLDRLSRRRDHPARRHQAYRGQSLFTGGNRQLGNAADQAGFGDAEESRLPLACRVRHPRRAVDQAVGQPVVQPDQCADSRDAGRPLPLSADPRPRRRDDARGADDWRSARHPLPHSDREAHRRR